jgi:hypothetical protein
LHVFLVGLYERSLVLACCERGFGVFSDRLGFLAWAAMPVAGFVRFGLCRFCAGSAMSVPRFDPCGWCFGLLLWRSSSALAAGFGPSAKINTDVEAFL